MINFPWRVNRAIITAAALTAAGLTTAFAAPAASAQPGGSAHGKPGTVAGAPAHGKPGPAAGTTKGDNGDVKIHNSTTAVTDERNEPHVCVFYLDAFNFDSAQSVSWQIRSWPPTGNRSVVTSGALVLGSDGTGHTGDMSLPNGHYKLFWNFAGENGFAKQKVFWVACPAQAPTPPPVHHKHKGKQTPPSVPAAPAPKPVSSTLPVTG